MCVNTKYHWTAQCISISRGNGFKTGLPAYISHFDNGPPSPEASTEYIHCLLLSCIIVLDHIVNSVCWSHARVNDPTSETPVSDGGLCIG